MKPAHCSTVAGARRVVQQDRGPFAVEMHAVERGFMRSGEESRDRTRPPLHTIDGDEFVAEDAIPARVMASIYAGVSKTPRVARGKSRCQAAA